MRSEVVKQKGQTVDFTSLSNFTMEKTGWSRGVRLWRVLLFNDPRIKLTNHATCWSDKFLIAVFILYISPLPLKSIYNIG